MRRRVGYGAGKRYQIRVWRGHQCEGLAHADSLDDAHESAEHMKRNIALQGDVVVITDLDTAYNSAVWIEKIT